ncbi:MAG: type II toxin-antitoxin system Phd/YefM family antitoxin [Deltaproteobacteria bacterium]|nr:type II toxin-antitoxin system Phd/YefM family antitoxin [Deltaproteobacteria bacterium]
MRLGRSVKSITYLKTHTADVVRDVAEDGRPLVITQNGEACAVVMDVATFDRWREAMTLLKLLSLSEAEASAGRTATDDEAFARALAAAEAE